MASRHYRHRHPSIPPDADCFPISWNDIDFGNRVFSDAAPAFRVDISTFRVGVTTFDGAAPDFVRHRGC
jgi:hypothetical protein